jgi:hypothetical protein
MFDLSIRSRNCFSVAVLRAICKSPPNKKLTHSYLQKQGELDSEEFVISKQ